MTWADYLFWALVAVALLYFGAWFHEVIEALEARLLSFLPAREVGEPTARRTPSRLENGAATEGPPGDGGNPGARLSARPAAAAPGTTLLIPRGRHAAGRPRLTEQVIASGTVTPVTGTPPAGWGPATMPSQRLDDATLAALEAQRREQVRAIAACGHDEFDWMQLPALAGARGGCTGMTNPQRALGLADLGPADDQGRTLAERITA